MKRTLLSISVAMALTSPLSFAADTAIDPSDDFLFEQSEGSTWGGHIGMSYEYEDKKKTFTSGTKDKEKTKTLEILSAFYRNNSWDFAAYYGFKKVDRDLRSVYTGGVYTEKEDSFKHLLSLDKGFMLSNGWDSGLIYDLEFTDGEYDKGNATGTTATGLNYQLLEHSVKPYITYWSNEYSAGIYSNLEYLNSTKDKDNQEDKEFGYSLLFKPYKRIGNWEFGVEFFYQTKDTETRSSGTLVKKTDYTEKYFEPIVQYSFEDAGTLYTRVRIGEKKTEVSNDSAWDTGATYLTDIRKATIGYEQAVGDNWLVKAEYELADEEEKKNGSKNMDIDQNTFFVQGLYRF